MSDAPGAARIGPNAITQVAAALERSLGQAPTQALMACAGLARYLREPPRQMVEEREVIALHTVLREQLQPPAVGSIARAAGEATGDYLLANRIPRPVQRVLGRLPARWASRVLLAAITRHAWTFAGSGHFRARAGRPVVIEIGDCPICRGAHSGSALCGYYAATFERLYRALVHPRAVVRETACIAAGSETCRFEIDWP